MPVAFKPLYTFGNYTRRESVVQMQRGFSSRLGHLRSVYKKSPSPRHTPESNLDLGKPINFVQAEDHPEELSTRGGRCTGPGKAARGQPGQGGHIPNNPTHALLAFPRTDQSLVDRHHFLHFYRRKSRHSAQLPRALLALKQEDQPFKGWGC